MLQWLAVFFLLEFFFLPCVPALDQSLACASTAELEQPFPAAGSALCWQRQSISSQGSCLCALKLCFSAPEGRAFPMNL